MFCHCFTYFTDVLAVPYDISIDHDDLQSSAASVASTAAYQSDVADSADVSQSELNPVPQVEYISSPSHPVYCCYGGVFTSITAKNACLMLAGIDAVSSGSCEDQR